MNSVVWQQVRPRSRPLSSSAFTLFAGNISFDTSAEDLFRIFGRYGKVVDTFIPWNPHLNRPRGYGFVRFQYEDDARAALRVLNGKRVDGRILLVQMAKAMTSSHPNQRPTRPTTQPTRPTPPIPGQTNNPLSTLSEPRSFAQAVQDPILPQLPDVQSNACVTQMVPNVMPYPAHGTFTIQADNRSVALKLKELSLALVGQVLDAHVQTSQILQEFRITRYMPSALDISCIGLDSFLLVFKSRSGMISFFSNSMLHMKMGFAKVEA
ncbi:uncharacterized protein LOC131236323 [Magnolia sinica]|uniref:uncharacterized protein LOC131236323 n=1 Tax=Magnolia sinica TaxID=86752 RepID=UPI0026583AC2|nr:uncharacterized protein LOC131236323 [Magnolia sinica]